MSGVDNRIVTMQFNNRDFETNARTSLSTLQKIKEGMNFGTLASSSIKALGSIGTAIGKLGAGTPFAPLVSAAQKGFGLIGGVIDRLGIKNPFSSAIQGTSDLARGAQVAGGPGGMGVLEGGVTAVSAKFVALTTVAVTALSNITNKAINAGTAFAKSFTIQPILDGLHEYETNLQAIQTVQANTDRPLPEINAALQELNKYSDQTIYNFGEMAKNVGTFTAAGVDLETSVSSIKGIANLAALSGSSSQQAATAMYQLSQAISSGRVGLMDWNSVVNAGMGGKKLQNALAQTAVAMGDIEAQSVKMSGPMQKLTINGQSFRESIMTAPGSEPWLTSDILVNTLATMDGRFSKAALAAETTTTGLRKYSDAQIEARINTARTALEQKNGVKYSNEQFKALQKMSTSAFEAATQVKTLGQVFDIAKETIGSGWSASFKSIFGNLNEAKALFTGMSNGLNDIIKKNALARNTLLVAWAKGGGRTDVIDGLKNAWQALLNIMGPIKEGFRDIFPAKTADDLISMSSAFKDFTAGLIPGKKTMGEIRDISGGLFAALHIVGEVVAAVATHFVDLFQNLDAGSGGFLALAATVGRAIKNFDTFLNKSGLLESFLNGLDGILSVPINLLAGLAGLIANIFTGFDGGAAKQVGGAIDGVGKSLGGLSAWGDKIQAFFKKIGDLFGGIGETIGKSLVGIGDVVAGAFTADTFGSTLDVINTTLLGGLVLLIKNFFSKGVNIDLTGGLFDGIKETLGSATGAFENMQNTLKADILLKLAFAIGVMAAALLVLSTIDPASLTKALAAMSGGFGVLIGAMAVLLKVMGPAGLVQLYVITSAMTKMAASILLLAFALRIMSNISFGDMIRGLVGLGGALFIIQKAMVPLAASSKGMGRASASLILLGIALNLIAVALKVMATMSWEEIAKGLATMTGALLGIVVAMRLMPKGILVQAAAILVLSVALNAMALALRVMGTMKWEEIAKGLLTTTGALVAIGLGMRAMPKGMLLQAAALVAVSGALVVLSGALKIMGSMGWESIAKGLIVLAGALLIIAVGLQAIGVVGTIGAVGLVAAAGALAVLVPVMVALGALSWESIAKGLLTIAAIFTILGVAGYLLAPVVVVIVALAASLLLLGAGLALAGAGALAAATAFGIIVAAGAAGIQILVGLLATIIAAIPPAMAAFANGVVQFAVAIGEGAPRIAKAFGQILSNLLDSVIKNAPKLARAFLAMLNAALKVVVTAAPKISNAGLALIVGFLQAISSHISQIIDIAADIIVKFLDGISRNLGRIIQSGVRLIIAFINGVADAIDNNSEQMGQAGGRLAVSMVHGMASGITGAAGIIKDAAINAAKSAFDAVKDFFKIGSPSKLMRDEVGARLPQGMALGVKDDAGLVTNEIETMGKSAIAKMNDTMAGINDAFALDPNMSPTVTPVLDLSALTQEANKMSSILATAPIMAGVSYATAADISALTTASSEADNGSDGPGNNGGGDTYVTLEQNLHSPRPIDSVEAYRGGKSLISLAKEALK